jgi:hypothetical protein
LTLIGAKIEVGGADVPDFHLLEVEQKYRCGALSPNRGGSSMAPLQRN